MAKEQYGRWKGAGMGDYSCSICGSVYSGADRFKYCPNCAAQMYETNADRIRAMSDEELADFISNCGCPDHATNCRASCKDCAMEWLKQPAEV